MTTPSTHRPSSAMVVAMIALFVAIGGTALALPGQNTVNSGDVKDETLKSQDLKDEQAVASSDVIDEAIQSEDIANNTLQSDDYGAESIESGDIGQNQVGQSEIAFDAVSSFEIIDGEVHTADLGNSAVSSGKIVTGGVGSGDLATILVAEDATPHDFADQDEGNNDYLYGTSIADCPAGSTVIGGGARWLAGYGGAGGDELQAITEVRLASNGIIARAVSDVDNDDFTAIAYCLSTGA